MATLIARNPYLSSSYLLHHKWSAMRIKHLGILIIIIIII